ncbi:hypothetical protein [Bradyrhizobium sp. RP6]|uniref:hypothetical protein n=1 Tax=Bradyrhizobium sp. RP6 TaxID=2489596 RepID=UPI000F526E45|nr:hypothetical protein [Bradyrhizobium sp. RP6]RQH14925.1 hypothetical protein EHH60_07025 [Bradyrhizobium sp. RP6]
MQFNLTANGATDPVRWFGGRGSVSVWGTFGGGTVTLQMSPDSGTTWLDVDRTGDSFVTFTTPGVAGFELAPCLLRVNLTSAESPSLNFKANRS